MHGLAQTQASIACTFYYKTGIGVTFCQFASRTKGMDKKRRKLAIAQQEHLNLPTNQRVSLEKCIFDVCLRFLAVS
jgi:hypothetical protein